MSENVIVLSEKEKRIIGERLRYLDQLFTDAIRTIGYGYMTEYYIADVLGQMIALANEVGVSCVKPEDILSIFNKYFEDDFKSAITRYKLRIDLYKLRAKLIAECVKAGVIECLKEIPIGVVSHEFDSKQANSESLYF